MNGPFTYCYQVLEYVSNVNACEIDKFAHLYIELSYSRRHTCVWLPKSSDILLKRNYKNPVMEDRDVATQMCEFSSQVYLEMGHLAP